MPVCVLVLGKWTVGDVGCCVQQGGRLQPVLGKHMMTTHEYSEDKREVAAACV